MFQWHRTLIHVVDDTLFLGKNQLSTVDPKRSPSDREQRDRDLFDRAAERYYRKDLLPTSRCARQLRLQRTLKPIPWRDSFHVMEVGCGAGFAATYLEGHYAHYVGIDHSERLIELARRFNCHANAEFLATSIQQFEPRQQFDVIFMIGVLHHLEDCAAVLPELVQMLRPGGWLAVNEPVRGNPLIGMARRTRKRMDKDYSDDQIEMSRNEVREAFVQAGLEVVAVVPQGIISTPLAEVPLRPQVLFSPVSRVCSWVDVVAENAAGSLLWPFAWNLVAVGQRH